MTYQDLEFGPIVLTAKMKRFVAWFKRHQHNMKYFIISFVFLTIAIIIKFGFRNIDSVIESATAITLDEPVYTPFVLTDEIIPVVEKKSVIRFPFKESHINWKLQTLNLVQSRNQVLIYLEQVGYTCIHLRHFGVPYDILVFTNMTVVNPEVIEESEEYQMIKEYDLDGTTKRSKRPTYIKIAYLDESLNKKSVTLFGDQAVCFAHYEFD